MHVPYVTYVRIVLAHCRDPYHELDEHLSEEIFGGYDDFPIPLLLYGIDR